MERMVGKTVLITGAARGQGRNHAVRLAEEGANIIAVDICAPVENVTYPMASEEDLALTEQMVRDRGRSILAFQADVRDAEAMRAVVDSAVRSFGSLDAVVANAGVLVGGPFEEVSEAASRTVLEVNVLGTRNTCLTVLPHLRTNNGGSIVMTSSIAGYLSAPKVAAYAASKHGVVGLMRALAVEFGPDRIRVNAISPGPVFGTVMLEASESLATPTEKEQAAYVTALPNTTVEPDDISAAVVYLASDESRYVTGTIVTVDAGTATL